MIVRPAPESQTKGPDVMVEGWAWSCDGVERVDVSLDEGQTWHPSQIEPRTEFSWQKYCAKLTLDRGTYVVLAKATGHDGREQPLEEGRNHVHRVKIEVL